MSEVGMTAREMLAQGGGTALKPKSEAERAAAFDDAVRPFLEDEPAQAAPESDFGQGVLEPPEQAEVPTLNEFGMTQAAFEALPQAVRDRLVTPAAAPTPKPAEPAKPLAPETMAERLARLEKREAEREFNANAGLYPELKNKPARDAIGTIADAQYGGDRVAALRAVYGDRKAETRSQAYAQMSAPPRAGEKEKLTRDQVNEAAFNELWKTGDYGRAANTKRQLEGR